MNKSMIAFAMMAIFALSGITNNAVAAEQVLDVNMKAAARLPFSGDGVKQISGLEVKLGADGSFTTPDEVCTLIFARGEARVVVRVWENKDHRYFVSPSGDDGNDGSETRPFKTLLHAHETVQKNDPEGDIYCAGGDYIIELDKSVSFRFKVSLYGGFDQANGWRRDPAIHQSVLLPNGFRENWIDDMCDRFKDLRRTDHRYSETRIWSSYAGASAEFKRGRTGTIEFGGKKGSGREGTPDTYVDGLTFYGCNITGVYQPDFAGIGERSTRTFRHCIWVMFWNNNHAFLPGSGGRGGLFTNNISWGGIVGHEGHARPQMVFRGGETIRRTLHVGATGGDYIRMFLCWEQGGLVEGCQINAGNCSGWTTMAQVEHGAKKATQDYRFINNEVVADHITSPGNGSGLVLEGNRFHLRGTPFNEALTMWRALTIRDNTFFLPKQPADDILQAAKAVKLGGTWTFDASKRKPDDPGKLTPPADGKYTAAIIENNKIVVDPAVGPRPADYVDVARLSELVKTRGEKCALRPEDPAKNLKATPAGKGAVTLTWQPSKDPDVVGYRIYYGPRPNSYANTLVVTGKTEAEIRDLPSGKCYFTAAAHKDGFVECWKMSNEAVVEVK